MATARRRQRKIDFVKWTGFTGAAFALAADSTVAVNIGGAAASPATLLRTRGEWMAWLEPALAPAKSVRITCGIIIVPEGTGTTVLWNPVSDANAPCPSGSCA